jgi:hypothetical protein
MKGGTDRQAEKLGGQQHMTDSTGNEGWTLSKQKKRRGHYGLALSFTRAITDIKRRPPGSEEMAVSL